jgi:two-component system CheB/CheR fusion protein
LHGGRVEVDSEGEGKGATFRVFLPLRQSSDFMALEATAIRTGSPNLGGLRVLLVDDSEDALETFRYLLEHAGYEATCATSARKAIELTEQHDFDLLISDIGMPQMDGYDLMTELRARPRTAALPAIALTGYGRTEDVKHAFAAGFHAHVDKPVDMEHLKAVIAAVMEATREGKPAERSEAG